MLSSDPRDPRRKRPNKMSLRRILLATLTVLCVLASSTSLEQNDDLSFILIGDWGGMPFFPYRTPIESAVAKQMGKSANEIGAQFVVALGDNFYFHGVKNENDDRFKETFENVFVAPSLQIPWYMCAGNHDHYGNASAEIAYTKKSTRWTFPDFYYSKTFKITSSDKVLELVMIDTVLLCGNTEHDNIKGHATEGPRSVEESETQWVWLEKTLNASKSDYLLVGGHFPVWSIAEHGPTECLVDRLKPLLERYHATAYLCGHDHNLQHLKEPNSTVQYFVTGAGAYVEKNRDHEHSVPAGSLKFFWANAFSYGGFSTVQATTNSLTITFVDAEGRKLYNYAMKPRTGTYY